MVDQPLTLVPCHSMAITLKVFSLADFFAAFPTRLAALGSTPSASSPRIFLRPDVASASDVTGCTPSTNVFCFSAKRKVKRQYLPFAVTCRYSPCPSLCLSHVGLPQCLMFATKVASSAILLPDCWYVACSLEFFRYVPTDVPTKCWYVMLSSEIA